MTNAIITSCFSSHPSMSKMIRTRIVKIGNSQGVRIPKLLLEQSGIQTDVEIEVEGDHLTIRNARRLRTGWEQAFAAMAKEQDDVLLDPVNSTDWEQSEWEW
ncbi:MULTISPECIES: AbrB/MazE/SpoVT family DNA-binding domain-containing protein [Oscillatoriales]